MRILHVHDFYRKGNGRYGYDLCRALVRAGNKCHILAGVGKDGPANGTEIDGVVFHTYPYSRSLSFGPLLVQSLRKALKGYRFDILIFYQPLSSFFANRFLGPSLAPQLYGFLSPWAEEWEVESKYRGYPSWCRPYLYLFGYLRDRLETQALKGASGIFAISEFMKQRLLQRHPCISASKVWVITCGVDSQRFSQKGTKVENRQRLGWPQQGPLLFTLRRLVHRMGIDLLIKAMPEILRAFPKTKLMIGGEGPARSALERLGYQLNLSGHIKWLGYVDEAELPYMYRAADLCILPSRALEGFGLVAVEAMACGTPVMATPTGALPELLAPFDRGMLFESSEPGAIAEGIVRFLRSPISEDPGFSLRCRQYVILNYNWDNVASCLQRLLEMCK